MVEEQDQEQQQVEQEHGNEQTSSLVSSENQQNEEQEVMAGQPITAAKKNKLVAAFIAFSIILGYFAASLSGWSFFSWHPFLMITGFIGILGSSAIIKKQGGYTNTKLHAILSSTGLMMAFGGLYVIYKNKENIGHEHFISIHAHAGIMTIAVAVLPAIAGGVFLHPDFGIDKTNKTYRSAHKWSARIVMTSAWITALFGLMKLTSDIKILATFIVTLVVLAPMTLV